MLYDITYGKARMQNPPSSPNPTEGPIFVLDEKLIGMDYRVYILYRDKRRLCFH